MHSWSEARGEGGLLQNVSSCPSISTGTWLIFFHLPDTWLVLPVRNVIIIFSSQALTDQDTKQLLSSNDGRPLIPIIGK